MNQDRILGRTVLIGYDRVPLPSGVGLYLPALAAGPLLAQSLERQQRGENCDLALCAVARRGRDRRGGRVLANDV